MKELALVVPSWNMLSDKKEFSQEVAQKKPGGGRQRASARRRKGSLQSGRIVFLSLAQGEFRP